MAQTSEIEWFVKILFLSGSLEPGKDGVGDYARMLAAECRRLGHEPFLLSLNDQWLAGKLQQPAELRLGAQISWPDRISAARAFLAQNGPQIVSLQFVPYSFHPAGLNFALPQILRAIMGQRRVQIMFHEIWIGSHKGTPLQVKILGFSQRLIIRRVVKTLDCPTVHTSNVVYTRLLARYGIDAIHLPLFGNVPVLEAGNKSRRGDSRLSLGLFGSIHPEWNPDKMLAELRKLGRSVRMTHVGRIGPGESVWNNLKKRYQGEIAFCRLGEQSPDYISRFFGSLDFGVATTPLSLIGKSGSVAAMLDHGLPVIVTRDDIHFRDLKDTGPISERLIPVDEAFLERLTAAQRHPPKPRLPEVAAQFLRDIGP
jgi:glycosyltransferase involved in cell wall biosynthesis